MITFLEWSEATGNHIQIDEALGRKVWVKAVALSLTAKAHQQRNKVRNARLTRIAS